jgi:putative ABC transport system permease protein
VRLSRKQPAFAAVVALSLALGLGATTALFNLTWHVLLAPLPLPHPDQLTALLRSNDREQDDAFSWNEYQALKQTPRVGSFAAVRSASQIAVGYGETREYVNMHFVDGAYFPLLGLRPLAGRLLTSADDERQMTVAVVSQRFAAALVSRDSSAVGRTILIRGVPFTVVGVTPRVFRGIEYPGQFTVAIPLSTLPLLAAAGPREDDRGNSLDLGHGGGGESRRAYRIVGRLAADRRAATSALNATLARCCATGGAPERLTLRDIRRGIPGGKDDMRDVLGSILLILLAAMGLVLGVVCTNIASLLVVRTTAREREIAVRLSLGASRARVVSQLLLETLPLALCGGVLGLVVAGWTTWGITRSVPEWGIYIDMSTFRPEPRVLLFAGAIALLCGVAFAVYPALRATRRDLAAALGHGGRTSRGRRQGMVARGVVVAQLALTVVLVTAATLFLATLQNLGRVDGGFVTDHLLLVTLEARGTTYERQGVGPLHPQLLETIGGLPGVRGAAMASMIPLFGGNMSSLAVDVPGYEPTSHELPTVRLDAVAANYFATLGIPLVQGRDFTRADAASPEPVAIVSTAFAARYFAGRESVGHTFRATLHSDSLESVRVVGVVGDAKYESLRQGDEPLVYLPLAQTPAGWNSLQIGVRTSGDPVALAPTVRRAVDAAAPGLRIRRVSDMRTQVRMATTMERLATGLAGAAALLAIALSMMGLYGVVAHTVAHRTRELGIRIALGAQGGAIVRLVMGDNSTLIGAGVALGLALSVAANAAIRSQFFGVGAHDPVVTILSLLVIFAAAMGAAAVPSMRAIRIDPRIALVAE